jgi:hypothetical protein
MRVSKPKTTLMLLSRTLISRVIIFLFMVMVGFSLAKGIQSQSVLAIILSVTSLSAGVYFIHLLAKAKEDLEREKAV